MARPKTLSKKASSKKQLRKSAEKRRKSKKNPQSESESAASDVASERPSPAHQSQDDHPSGEGSNLDFPDSPLLTPTPPHRSAERSFPSSSHERLNRSPERTPSHRSPERTPHHRSPVSQLAVCLVGHFWTVFSLVIRGSLAGAQLATFIFPVIKRESTVLQLG